MSGVISTSLQTQIQKTLVDVFRDFFSKRDDFEYSTNPAESTVNIYSEFPKRTFKLPSIIVNHISGNPLMTTIGDRTFQVIRGERIVNGITLQNAICGYRHGGGHELEIEILITANNAAELRTLKDYSATALSVIYKKYLESKNISIESMRVGKDSTVVVGTSLIHASTLSLKVYTEWRETIYNVPLISKILNIGITTSI